MIKLKRAHMVALIHTASCPSEKRRLRHSDTRDEHVQRKVPWEEGVERCPCASQAESSHENRHADTWVLDFSASRADRKYVLVVSDAQSVVFLLWQL